MAPLPSPSLGVLTAPLGDVTVLYDTVTQMVHLLNPTAGYLWLACAEGLAEAEVVTELQAEGASASIGSDIATALDELRTAGLVDRTDPAPTAARPEPETVPSGEHVSGTYGVGPESVCFRAEDPALLEAVDDLLASMARPGPATAEIGLRQDGDDLLLQGLDRDRRYSSLEGLLEALPTNLNTLVATTTTCLTLHTGCVRSPGGEVMLLPAVSGSGKTTLTAALVQAGWTYASDEAIGVHEGSLIVDAYAKPLVLNASSREVLDLEVDGSENLRPSALGPDVTTVAGAVGPVARIVLPRYEEGAEVTLDPPLEPRDAIVAVLEHALNVAKVGEPALRTVCQLAERVPVQRLTHGNAPAAARSLSHPPS